MKRQEADIKKIYNKKTDLNFKSVFYCLSWINYKATFALGPAFTISAGMLGYLAEKLSANI